MEGESIYGWIEHAAAPESKPKRHVSKFDPRAPVPASTISGKKKPAATMGRSVKGTANPRNFLKAGAKTSALDAPSGMYGGRSRVKTPKAAVPSRHERPVCGVKSTKNFVVANAVENILAAPKVVDRGHPDYLRKSDFGKVPAYLGEVKREIEAEQEFIEGMIREQTEVDMGPIPTELPEDERMALVEALKAKWDIVNHEYQKITFKRISSTNSTAGAIRRKEECERQLAELERDIERLSARGPVYVVDA